MKQYEFKLNSNGVDTVTCLKSKSSFSFLREGAELVSYRIFDKRKSEPIGLLYRDGDISPPEKGWKNHATVLFPVVGRLKNGESRLGEKKIGFKKNHGFARSTVFTLKEHREEGAKAILT